MAINLHDLAQVVDTTSCLDFSVFLPTIKFPFLVNRTEMGKPKKTYRLPTVTFLLGLPNGKATKFD